MNCSRFTSGSLIAGGVTFAALASADCPEGFGPIPVPNVTWTVPDSVSACPAGDSLVFPHSPLHPHASRLRVLITYNDSDCNPKSNVPAESILVTSQIINGTLKLNDKSGTNHRPDYYATNSAGRTWVTFPSSSGCGKVRLRLYVSGVYQGLKDVVVRSTDYNTDGRVASGDLGSGQQCDINFDGIASSSDQDIANAHNQHWHRNALHGGLEQRTSLGVSGLGSGKVFWSPSGRYLSFGFHPPGPCAVGFVASNPSDGGNAIRQVTFPTPGRPDYDPSWSPLNDIITYVRGDSTLFAHSLVGFGGNGSTYVVHRHNDGSATDPRGVVTSAISPDGQWVAFSRRDVSQGPYYLYKIAISGDQSTLRKLTDGGEYTEDWYPTWSPDGAWILFQRESQTDSHYRVLRVSANGDSTQTPEEVYTNAQGKPASWDATTPAYSPDGKIVIAGMGPQITDGVFTHTLDAALTTKPKIPNFVDSRFASKRIGDFPILSPVLSPDGTRLALISNQIWAAKQSMNKPPVITALFEEGSQGSVADTAVTKTFNNVPINESTAFVFTTSDPEGDAITCSAYMLQPWMQFQPSLCRLTVTPPASALGKTFYVKLVATTASGGTDAIIAIIKILEVASSAGRFSTAGARDESGLDSPNPATGQFFLSTPYAPGVPARLDIFDLTGRKVSEVRGLSGKRLEWNGIDRSGRRVQPGIYLYRLDVGRERRDGKFVLVR